MYYTDILFKLRCASQLLSSNLFPNTKEWEESWGMYQAVKKAVGTQILGNKRVMLVSVGDGHTPRTAALFACMSRWKCVSIDPCLRLKDYGIDRLKLVRDKVENVSLDYEGDYLIIVGVHAHISLKDTLRSIRPIGNTQRHLFFMPCCFQSDLDIRPHDRFQDKHIHSPHNWIEVWNKI